MENQNNNLKPFKPGDDSRRNLKGAPKKLPHLDELISEALATPHGDITVAQAILAAISAKAMKGDVRAAELLLNRAYGKPKETVEFKNILLGKDLADETYV
jgi:hypothetical protein